MEQNLKFFIYARKSTEAEDKQSLSIPSQLSELNSIAQRQSLHLVGKPFEESKTAKNTGRRVFTEMLKSIEKGKANALLVWHPDRLSRNALDTGWIIHLLDTNKLVEVKTPTQVFHNTPNDKFFLSLLCSTAKLENDNKGVNVKRGLKKKAEMGWFPAGIPIGYMCDTSNPQGLREVKVDPERYEMVRKIFDLMLSGTHTPPKIWQMSIDEWGLRTRHGTKFSRSGIYRIFTNPFYYGMFEYPKRSGNWYHGKHKPMISLEEYDRIQTLLGKEGNPRPQSHVFAFTGMIRCGECGATITCEEKNQVICSACKFKFSYKNTHTCPKCDTTIDNMENPKLLRYVYYHCSKSKVIKCSQDVIEEKVLEKQITELLEKIEIPERIHSWAMKHLRLVNHNEAKARDAILSNQRKQYTECLKKLDNLIDMRASDEVSEEDFIRKKAVYIQDKQRFQELLNDTDARANKWIETAERVFTFARDARKKFITGSLEDKRQILEAVGSNLTLKNKVLTVEIEKPLVLIEKISQEVKSIIPKFEPEKDLQNSAYSEQLYADNLKMLRR
ncbi:MAG: recombinase family protein [Elusimicrobia bacterium]|nr:recombinase family protein [Elusimicrobiota bacterium]